MSVSPIPEQLARRWSQADDCGTQGVAVSVAVTAAAPGTEQRAATAAQYGLPVYLRVCAAYCQAHDPDEGGVEMPKVSSDSASQRQETGPVVDLRDDLDGYTVSFTSLLEDIDATPFMKGLPDDRCQCPHWGYVLKGKMTARYADRDEVFEAGDAFYIPPGHIPVENEPGTEFLWFSPSEELRMAEAVMMQNVQAMQDGSRLSYFDLKKSKRVDR